ncbi:MAG: hypothetical protein KTR31_16775 [Myxococcales bacterium]|nr:hypothetical protein [Myxococcales bacterium]
MYVRLAWVSIVLAGCFDMGRAPDEVPEQPAKSDAKPEQTLAVPGPSGAAAEKKTERLGAVKEVLTSAGYTYALLENCGEEAWVAGPETELEVGAVVVMPEGMGMENFRSPSLDRTFDTILFVDYLRPTTDEITCAEKPPPAPVGRQGTSGHDNEEKPPPPKAYHGKVVETMESAGYTYAKLEHCGQETWLAAPRIPLQVGQFVKARKGDEMNGFTSKSLGRTFDSIFFVPSMAIAPNGPACR